jgi:hypothetical protein
MTHADTGVIAPRGPGLISFGPSIGNIIYDNSKPGLIPIPDQLDISKLPLRSLLQYHSACIAAYRPPADMARDKCGTLIGNSVLRGEFDLRPEGARNRDFDSHERFFTWTAFPAISRSAGGTTMMTYIAMYSSWRLDTDNLHHTSIYESVRLPSGRTCFVETTLISEPNALQSIYAALASSEPRNGTYITFAPLRESKDYDRMGQIPYRLGGASLGMAVFGAVQGWPPLLYTGFVRSLGSRPIKNNINQSQPVSWRNPSPGVEQGGPTPMLVNSDIIEVVDGIELKVLAALHWKVPIICPAKGPFAEPIKPIVEGQRSYFNTIMNLGSRMFCSMSDIQDHTVVSRGLALPMVYIAVTLTEAAVMSSIAFVAMTADIETAALNSSLVNRIRDEDFDFVKQKSDATARARANALKLLGNQPGIVDFDWGASQRKAIKDRADQARKDTRDSKTAAKRAKENVPGYKARKPPVPKEATVRKRAETARKKSDAAAAKRALQARIQRGNIYSDDAPSAYVDAAPSRENRQQLMAPPSTGEDGASNTQTAHEEQQPPPQPDADDGDPVDAKTPPPTQPARGLNRQAAPFTMNPAAAARKGVKNIGAITFPQQGGLPFGSKAAEAKGAQAAGKFGKSASKGAGNLSGAGREIGSVLGDIGSGLGDIWSACSGKFAQSPVRIFGKAITPIIPPRLAAHVDTYDGGKLHGELAQAISQIHRWHADPSKVPVPSYAAGVAKLITGSKHLMTRVVESQPHHKAMSLMDHLHAIGFHSPL